MTPSYMTALDSVVKQLEESISGRSGLSQTSNETTTRTVSRGGGLGSAGVGPAMTAGASGSGGAVVVAGSALMTGKGEAQCEGGQMSAVVAAANQAVRLRPVGSRPATLAPISYVGPDGDLL